MHELFLNSSRSFVKNVRQIANDKVVIRGCGISDNVLKYFLRLRESEEELL